MYVHICMYWYFFCVCMYVREYVHINYIITDGFIGVPDFYELPPFTDYNSSNITVNFTCNDEFECRNTTLRSNDSCDSYGDYVAVTCALGIYRIIRFIIIVIYIYNFQNVMMENTDFIIVGLPIHLMISFVLLVYHKDVLEVLGAHCVVMVLMIQMYLLYYVKSLDIEVCKCCYEVLIISLCLHIITMLFTDGRLLPPDRALYGSSPRGTFYFNNFQCPYNAISLDDCEANITFSDECLSGNLEYILQCFDAEGMVLIYTCMFE